MSVSPTTTNRPVKPLRPYKLYRRQRLNQEPPSQLFPQVIKQQWKNLDPQTKQSMQLKYELEYKAYVQEKSRWQEQYGPLKLMHKQKSRQKSHQHSVQKSKGNIKCSQDSIKFYKRLKKKKREESEDDDDRENQYSKAKQESKVGYRDWINDQQSNEKISLSKQQQPQANMGKVAKTKKKKIESEWGEQMVQEYKDQQLMVTKRQDKGSEHLISRLNQKVDFFKNRLSFKDAGKDFKYKQHIKQKLKGLDQCQEINLVVQIPKVLGGKGCLEGALYLKNVKQKSDTIHSQISLINNEESIPKDRRSYYQNFEKQLKLKKSEVISQSALKQCFRQSSLDESDVFDQERDYQKANKAKQTEKEEDSLQKSARSSMDQLSSCTKNSVQSKQPFAFNMIRVYKASPDQSFSLTSHKQHKHTAPTPNSQSEPEVGQCKAKGGQKRTAKKQLRRHLKGFIQQQAQNSGQQDKSRESSEEDDNTDISSLIDNDVVVSEQDQILVHNKFVHDMIEKEEREYSNMRKNLEKKYIEEEENLRRRMKEAAKKNTQKQQEEEKAQIHFQQQDLVGQCDTQNESCTVNNNKKLTQLQQELGIKPVVCRKVEEKSLGLMVDIQGIERAMLEKRKGDMKKPMRGGMKSMIQLKGVQAHVKTRMKK